MGKFRNFVSIFKEPNKSMDKDEISRLLQTTPEALEAFETAYSKAAIQMDENSDNFFDVNAKQAKEKLKEGHMEEKSVAVDHLVNRIINELLSETEVYVFDGEKAYIRHFPNKRNVPDVSIEEIMALPESNRPQLAGKLMKKDINGSSYPMLLEMYKKSLKSKDAYNLFRQGLDILDLDPVVYAMLDTNPNAIGHWFPTLVEAVKHQSFFKLPKTSILKVPLTMLQLTRTDYENLTPTTLRIVDEYCQRAFNLDLDKEYFVKTGTYSSKFDFRNAHVHGEKEVKELGEYLLFIHHQAIRMAMPLSSPVIYGVSSTTEWCVREYISDTECNPTIYKGMPLHTEYRVFVDFDAQEILGISPYWEPETMKKRFGCSSDSNSPHMKHDYVIYSMHEAKLMERYDDNVQMVKDKIQKLLPFINMTGQWSIDIMQNGNDFWIIDMALAVNSALIECVPPSKLKPYKENWIPRIGKLDIS